MSSYSFQYYYFPFDLTNLKPNETNLVQNICYYNLEDKENNNAIIGNISYDVSSKVVTVTFFNTITFLKNNNILSFKSPYASINQKTTETLSSSNIIPFKDNVVIPLNTVTLYSIPQEIKVPGFTTNPTVLVTLLTQPIIV